MKKNNKGITLVSLVITVIVMLILAGVAINLITGEDQLFQKVRRATIEYKEASERENMMIAKYQNWIMESMENINDTPVDPPAVVVADVEGVDVWDGSVVSTLEQNQDGNYYIFTCAQLKWLSDYTNAGNDTTGMNIIVKSDLNLNGSTEQVWTPIGNNTNTFKGNFDGNNHTISGLHQYTETCGNYTGLFGYNIGTIKKVNLTNVNINRLYNSGYIYSGGICGYNTGTVEKCSVSGIIRGSGSTSGYTYCYIGGVVGYNNNGTIKRCTNSASVVSTNNKAMLGGVVGQSMTSGIIQQCANLANLNTSSYYTGGIVGQNYGLTEECYNKGDISADYETGGIAGANRGTQNSIINNCYNTGQISGSYNTGGITGSYDIVRNCYNVGTIGNGYSSDRGAIIGARSSSAENCYYLSTVGAGNSSGGTSKTRAQMITGDFVTLLGTTVWCQDTGNINSGYPILKWQIES